MTRDLFVASLGFGALILAADHAAGQTAGNCATRDRVIERLAAAYGETRQSIGLGADNHVVEVFASHETGTWTIIVTTPAGISCLVASGQAYEALATSPQPPGEET